MSDLPALPGTQNLAFVEELYADFVRDPNSVSEEWRRYFERWGTSSPAVDGFRSGPSFKPKSLFHNGANGRNYGAPSSEMDAVVRQDQVDQLVRNFRVRGHRLARLDPLGFRGPELPELDPRTYGFTDADLDRTVSTRAVGGADTCSLRKLIQRLRNTYCRFIGAQFMHIDDLKVREWLQDRMEKSENRLQLRRSEQFRILTRLTDAVMFEEFIQKKFVGAKSFSLEGAETLIPLLDLAIEKAATQGIEGIVLGMAHRGRLNVLANIMGKNPQKIFREFEDLDPHLHHGRGDVKYHLGYSSDWQSVSGKNVHLTLCFNPSHLEFVNAVVMGRTRAKQDRHGDRDGSRSMAIMIHGDAAFAGEGVIQEILNMSELPAYRSGGALHVIVNNQIGFTTTAQEARSSTYASDVAKMLQIPIFHVNGESPESVAQVVQLALDFREKFRRDVVIDMYCFRLRGHNERDEPAFTQPLMYSAIAQRDSMRDSYLDHLLTQGGVTVDEADWIAEQTRERLEQELSVARGASYRHKFESGSGLWEPYCGGKDRDTPDAATGVPEPELQDLLRKLAMVPDDFHPHTNLKRFLKAREEMAEGRAPLDWAAAEALALTTLAKSGVRVRLSGQDVARGTFSQRHGVLHDMQDGHTYASMQGAVPGLGPIELYNSLLSENGVLGFDYGYSMDCPDGLVLWEAQFGDFCNAAQVIIDQFIVSAEEKWKRFSGVVMLLPHGFEGQGPEHSSARLERFLTLSAEDNIQVVVPSTPAQYFHMLRRQVLRPIRKPLIVMTPKSLLRHRRCVSTLADCANGGFQRIIPEPVQAKKKYQRVLMCCGKVYYDLLARREELKRDDVALVRIEQLYPLREEELQAALSPYAAGTQVYWVQEEPENMGAWRYLRVLFGEKLFGKYPFSVVARDASASPATGSSSSHNLEQEELLQAAYGGL